MYLAMFSEHQADSHSHDNFQYHGWFQADGIDSTRYYRVGFDPTIKHGAHASESIRYVCCDKQFQQDFTRFTWKLVREGNGRGRDINIMNQSCKVGGLTAPVRPAVLGVQALGP